MQTVAKQVENLVVGNRVDLSSCQYLKRHSSAGWEYARVEGVDRETENCVVVSYQGIDQVGYQVGSVLQVVVPTDVPDPEIQVRVIGKPEEWSVWNISQNLTDRWGDLNHYDWPNKPLALLEDDAPLYGRLCDQMWGEITFVARKDGKFGVLFEVEFCSLESEAPHKDNDPDWYVKLSPQNEVVKILLKGMAKLTDRFPGVEFAVPHESQIIEDRPAAWAFVPDGTLTAEQREALGHAMLSLY
ncbi:hypothetical protein [Azonexus hydrophilus]|uniref:Uncharacterized protein n=1 Tax=Azonexus hydrophilus TaxID=418702 RepID=A0ABZ2XQ88_9RHOO